MRNGGARLIWPLLLLAALRPAAALDLGEVDFGAVSVAIDLAPSEGALPMAGRDAVLRLTLDPPGGRGDMRPLAWLLADPDQALIEPTSCRQKVAIVQSGNLAARAAVDLNRYRIATLDREPSLGFIDPLVAFSRSQLEAVVALPEPGADWATTKDGRSLIVSLPKSDALAIVDVDRRKLIKTIDLPAGSQPWRLSTDPWSGRLWVVGEGRDTLFAIDPATWRTLAEVPVGPGPHALALAPDSMTVAIAGLADGRLDLLDAGGRPLVPPAHLGALADGPVFGAKSGRFYLAASTGALHAIDASTGAHQRHDLGVGLVHLAVEPAGRFLLLLRESGDLALFDTARERVVATTTVRGRPGHIAFTEGFAYLQGSETPGATLLELSALAAGRLAPIEISVGQMPAGPDPLGALVAAAPEGGAAWLAHPGERSLFFYMEGMMAPAGAISTYGRTPQAIRVLDAGLKPETEARLATRLRLPHAGHYVLALRPSPDAEPRCVPLDIAADPALAERAPPRPQVRSLLDGAAIAGQPVELPLEIVEAAKETPLRHLRRLRLLAFEPPGIWQERRRLTEIRPGVYSTALVFPRPGEYRLVLSQGRDVAAVLWQASITVTSGSRP